MQTQEEKKKRTFTWLALIIFGVAVVIAIPAIVFLVVFPLGPGFAGALMASGGYLLAKEFLA